MARQLFVYGLVHKITNKLFRNDKNVRHIPLFWDLLEADILRRNTEAKKMGYIVKKIKIEDIEKFIGKNEIKKG